MSFSRLNRLWLSLGLLSIAAVSANAQSFRVQCPTSTITHPDPTNAGVNSLVHAYSGPTQFTMGANGYLVPSAATVNGAIKCQQISGGDGYATMGDGTQTFMFSFGPLSGLAAVAAGHESTQFPSVFNNPFSGTLVRGDPASSDGAASGAAPWTGAPSAFVPAFTWNGAVGLAQDVVNTINISDAYEGPLPATTPPIVIPANCPATTATTVTVFTYEPISVPLGTSITIAGVGTGYDGTWPITCEISIAVVPSTGVTQYAFQYTSTVTGQATLNLLSGPTASTPPILDGHVDPRPIMDVGVMNGNIPAPLAAFDEDDEFFLTLTNVGMIMRPDLFEQHTVHFHGYPNASSFYDGVPDASVAINIGGSFTYYYLAPDAGTYFWHCHITPPEHLQMGMVGQLYVRPRQNRVPVGSGLYAALQKQQGDPRTACNSAVDVLCSNPLPATSNMVTRAATGKYAYNDGDGSTYYDVEYPLQIHGFDPNFHFVGMTFNPEAFVDMKDKYFLLNGRSYPDTVTPGPMQTQTADGQQHFSQPLPSIINIPAGKKALLRISDLDVQEFQTLASLGIPMTVIALNAKLLRDQAGNNMDYYTNSITLGGGESLDVILDASNTTLFPKGSVFFLYTPNLDHLSNDAENFGGLMTEIHIN